MTDQNTLLCTVEGTKQLSCNAHDEHSKPASYRVFGLPELLENILMHLPIFQLFVVQRVNTTFQRTIESSIQLQQRLYLRVDAPKAYQSVEWFEQHPLVENLMTWNGPYQIWSGAQLRAGALMRDINVNATWKRILVGTPKVAEARILEQLPDGMLSLKRIKIEKGCTLGKLLDDAALGKGRNIDHFITMEMDA